MSSQPKNDAITREERRCRTCRHYLTYTDPVQDGFGTCHRHAPQPRTTTDAEERETYFTSWPFVPYDAVCGEWAWNTTLEELIDDPEQNP